MNDLPYKKLIDIMIDQQIRRDNYLCALAAGDMHMKDIDIYHERILVVEKKEDKKINKCLRSMRAVK